MRRRAFALLAFTLGPLAGGVLPRAVGCGGAGVVPLDAGADARPLNDADTRPDTNAAPGDSDLPPPPGLPDGWEIYHDAHGYCGFYVPTDVGYLPPPIRWQACDSFVQPPGVSCQRMIVDWTGASNGTEVGLAVHAEADGSRVTIQFSRWIDKFIYRLIADADGPVRSAILETASDLECTLSGASFRRGRYAYGVNEHGSELDRAAIVGELDQLKPRATFAFPELVDHNFIASELGIIDWVQSARLDLYSWTDGSALGHIWSSEQDGLQQNRVFAGPGSILWKSGELTYALTRIYTADQGARVFVSPGPQPPGGSADLGTDGTDLVWLDASGTPDVSGLFPTLSIMTAPFTTDPAAIVPRRLRSETSPGFAIENFKVGCGFAARRNDSGIRIVRLSDGLSWHLPADPSAIWAWGDTVALTCTEFFGTIHIATPPYGHNNIARVRLDSLGPGIPPD